MLSLPVAWFRALLVSGGDGRRLALTGSLLLTVLIKWAVSLHSHSGKHSPPMYGDFEAQRHWLELTTHLPRELWYRYDLPYWGLDYPPLTALHSWLLGNLAHLINPSWVALDISRGNEDPNLIIFMRLTALLTESLILLPGIIWFSKLWFPSPTSWIEKNSWIFLMLLNPALIIIDHGHFQYNSAMLGLALLALSSFMDNRYILGSIFFCLSLNFKQMALFYAIPTFFFLLGRCIQMGFTRGFMMLIKLGVTVALIFAACIVAVAPSIEDAIQVFVRVFPVNRGLYEDKVANVWCAINVVVKLREIFKVSDLMKLSILCTLVAVLPAGLLVLCYPNRRTFMYSLIVGSLGFFLFSFQVHEKSILLPTLPISLFLLDDQVASSWFMNVAMFSMYPLLQRDGLALPYFALIGLWNVLNPAAFEYHGTLLKAGMLTSLSLMVGWHILDVSLSPLENYPDINVVLNVIISTAHFGLFFVYFYWQLWVSSSRGALSSAFSSTTALFIGVSTSPTSTFSSLKKFNSKSPTKNKVD
ncbi:hypothetical protein BASA50_006075 [Batrachochytrium salamandrivorans]|uniref:Alpha-1,3-glucosyltransferase n=1 Tax=Batrachochytrium salamandrivorans TaxID=1357716 RepID=A0ABQ8FDR1_9FUNG|nr:hypothetical protein BASA50_006075 [Batrachochytrium salamandrivorans]KAH6600914.1 hypothetical protein BASA61_002126 [Batrachochytrium salamandrivorans]KAH9252539.1 hypothetical protein BASA81_009498 [Batrachochytrium salamandrivorans]KAH9274369.1 hypothetical protein BASA83_003367 [Batrachochytrium salamandrivorans]